MHRDTYYQLSSSQALLMDNTNTAINSITGVSNDFRSYNPANSKYASVAITRSSVVDPQKSFSNLIANGRHSSYQHWFSNSSQVASATTNRISYLAPLVSRPNNYYWGQEITYIDPVKAIFTNHNTNGLNFYRFSNGSNVIVDQFKNDNVHWLYYNQINLDNNLLTVSNSGAVSKIEGTTNYQDRTDNPNTPLLFQTHGGIPENGLTTWRTDYARDSHWQSGDRETYIIYRPNFGSNVQIPTSVETMGEWNSNLTGERSGS